MRVPKRPAAILAVAGALAAGAVALGVLPAMGERDPGCQSREVERKVQLDEAHEQLAIDAPDGCTACGEEILELRGGSVTVPQGIGISWGSGDTLCGYGTEIYLPKGSVVCFDEDKGEVEVNNINKADAKLIAAVLDSVEGYKLRPSVLTGELP